MIKDIKKIVLLFSMIAAIMVLSKEDIKAEVVYEVKGDTMTISTYGDGDTKTTDAAQKHLNSKITQVVINDGITSIGTETFRDCKNLKSIMNP